MSTTTANLGLFKYVLPTDANVPFNINTALNNNWDILDNALENIDALPDQTDKSGYILTTDGTEPSWVDTTQVYPVIETYSNGSSWYRVYSDGWCEQGGVVTIADNTQITFAKPFVDTNYQGQITERVGTSFGQGQQNCRFYPTSTTYATCCAGITGGVLCQWIAMGYIN